MRLAHLLQQFAHVLRSRAGSSLIGHRSNPFHQIRLEQSGQCHQHQAHRAIAADKIFLALRQRILDHIQIDRIEDNDAVLVHPQRGSGIDPVTLPARRAKLGKHFGGVIAALTGNNGVHRF